MYAFIAALCIAVLSVIGILLFKNRHLHSEAMSPFLPLSIGAFLGVTFFELLPEAFHETKYASIALASGFLGFFFLSRILREYHHHHHIGDEHAHEDAHHKERGALVLMGDSVHNFADGIVIAVAFSVSPALGIATTLGIALHEIPQEIAELYILMRAGYSKKKALLLNVISALAVVLGALFTNAFMASFESLVGILIAVAAGNLLYIAASDLLPTLTDTHISRKTFIQQAGLVVVGLVAIASLLSFAHAHDETGHQEEETRSEAVGV
jgi:zinc and cadmium transporter